MAGLIVGEARGGKLARLGGLQLRWVAILVLGFLVQMGTPVVVRRSLLAGSWVGVSNVLAFGLYAVFAFANIGLPGLAWFFAGAGLNLVVIAANGGKMPVVVWAWVHFRPELLETLRAGLDPLHVLAGPSTHLAWLADYLVIPGIPSPVFSPGDLLIAIGAFLLLERGVRGVGLPGQKENGSAT
ncbi:MAG: DUF5317 domain-containing protein [Bacillota bacterium]|nr:DUF5317 domain-containing protein [Bacillota bacterium]